MEVIFIDCRKFNTVEAFYDETARRLFFPEYFGKNLDALSDCLDDVQADVLIYFYGFDGFAGIAGGKAGKIKSLFEKKRKLKPNIKAVFE